MLGKDQHVNVNDKTGRLAGGGPSPAPPHAHIRQYLGPEGLSAESVLPSRPALPISSSLGAGWARNLNLCNMLFRRLLAGQHLRAGMHIVKL